MKRFARYVVTPFRESKPQIQLGREPCESLSAQATTELAGGLAGGNRVNLLERCDYPYPAVCTATQLRPRPFAA